MSPWSLDEITEEGDRDLANGNYVDGKRLRADLERDKERQARDDRDGRDDRDYR
jgi:hypothetical protein